jgi:hypothetical protein
METFTLKLEVQYDVDHKTLVRESDGASVPVVVSTQAFVVMPNGRRFQLALTDDDECELSIQAQRHLNWCLAHPPREEGDYDGRFAL